MRSSITFCLLALALIGCGRSSPALPTGERTRAEPRASTGARSSKLSTSFLRPAAARVVAIGDLHGDLTATRSALRLAGAIDDSDRWIGGKLVVVQTGDVLDRGDEDRAVFDLLQRLRGEAERAGGALIALSGNHEIMNVAHDLRYVSEGGYESFQGPAGREAAFRPGGAYAKQLADWPVTVQVGDSVFVHGGILLPHVAYGLQRINEEIAAWMRGERAEQPAIMLSETAPVWTRLYSADPAPEDCAQLEQVLAALSARRMVVGHTPQPKGISSACDGKVWRIDVGMSRFYRGTVQVLQLEGEAVQARTFAN